MGQNPERPTTKLQVPIAVWVSIGGLVFAILLQVVYMAKTFGSLETTLQQHDKTIQSFQNSTTQTKINELEVTLARTQEQAIANKEEIRRISWQLNRIGAPGAPNWQPNNSTINKNTTGP